MPRFPSPSLGRTRVVFAPLLAVALLGSTRLLTAAEAPAFNRDIKPILSDHCFACHGPDPGSRKASLRLDTKEGLFESTPKRGPAVIAGKPEDSELWKRVVTTDADELMPPKKAHKDLDDRQKDLLRRWIADGAPWEPHWAFIKPKRPATPAVDAPGFPVRNPVDAFIIARLKARGLNPAPEADRRTLARRVALDLTGLPPAPQDVERFVQDASPDAYPRWVRKCMDSPRWGEHRARYWLDAARYADTHGLHFDNYREMWPYRDWVIRAFNRNQAFDAFTVEQLAGDLLPNPSEDQLIATGFQRCNATTNEGGTIEEENLVNYANDRVTTVGWVWLGLTANCAACHDHKFDPLTMRDFYSMAAYFRNTTQSGFDGNIKEGGNAHVTVIDNPDDQARWKALPDEITAAKSRVTERKETARTPFEPWAKALTPESVERALADGLVLRARVTEGSGREVAIAAGDKSAKVTIDGEPAWCPDGHDGASLRFENQGNVPLGNYGDFDLGQAFSFGGWVYVPKDYDDTASVVARMDEGSQHRGWDLWIQKGQFASHFVHQWPEDALKVRTKKSVVRKGEWQHVLVTFDGTGRPEGTRIYVDGVVAETETEGAKRVKGSIRIDTPLRLGRRNQGAAFKGGSVQDFRLFSRLLAAPEVKAIARMDDVRSLLATPFADWKTEARDEVFDYFLLRHAPYQEAKQHQAKLENERESLRTRYPVTHIQQEKKESMPMAAILFRGQYDKPKDQVTAGTPPVLHPMPEGAPTNRLGLASWLISPKNPLTARVTVNRFWQEIFGTGLVRTTEDFGIMGEPPTNPELLDWLAVEFEESGWDVKHLFELLVTSSAYRQSAATTPEKIEKDPANRLLSRGPRFRMDAEMVRDYALAAAGLLDPNLGGPSAKPYQPAGVWEAVAMPESNTREYKRDSGVALYRRSLYTFWKRSAPPALMDLFNAPSRETCTVRRERTNTPLQALATLNDPQFIEAARILAERALQHGGGPDGALAEMAPRILCRPLHPEELREVHDSFDAMRAFYESQPDQAAKLLEIGESQTHSSSPQPQLAALTMVANQLLNLDEVLNK